ncbi:hypothetical protein OIU34_22210 [Pararhizobium sp. BT-229]|uniref:hypothetical protein n=1 Tax=Pararhizobium sp. BT-229 TaxID=2986923 RepID=UPI0021F7EBEF|nr:hypothetical protein [Pararhizobium sp. BT-229]MCV9964608.1 hypothetical protein [Pararhizobium sp. BT-229]
MTTMDNFFETMKNSAKYAVVAASLTSMLITGFPGAAQANTDFIAAKNPSEIAQIEASYIAGKELGQFRDTVNVMVKTDILLRDTMMKMESAHWRLQDMDVGKATTSHVLQHGYTASRDIDLSAVKDIVKKAKDESGINFDGVAKNMEDRLESVSHLEQTLEEIADAYNAKDTAALQELMTKYDAQFQTLDALHSDAALSFLRPALDTPSYDTRKLDGDLDRLTRVDQQLTMSEGRLEKAVLRIARYTDESHSTESLLTKHQEYTASKDFNLDEVRQIAENVKDSVNVDDLMLNIEQRVELIGRMETRLDSIIKDYYTNNTESLSQNLNLYDMEAMEYTRLDKDSVLDAVRPESNAMHSSDAAGAHRGNSHQRSVLSRYTKVGITVNALRGRGL